MVAILVTCIWLAGGVLFTTLAAASWSAPLPEEAGRTYAHGKLNDVRIGLGILALGFAWSLTQMSDLWSLPWRPLVFWLLPLVVGIVWRRATFRPEVSPE